ncbi:hATC-domain-containing protein [Cylindrobasidium torrendii FP15055 ss-10]|uniref:HATC-domain-containing protein n=1 Tax=Cylindrobasidium torrendii FP15055 ss-10 TaxID=1314674 RepID=A0A0D7B9K9_9AGAR|nr:hATC-domain-containing protein [Cylindrobasidium torrendii FP15055 ss-10]
MFSFTQRKRTPAEVDELVRYLSTAAEPDIDDIVDWWISQRKTYPRLSRMALDYHSIPATSTAVERVFSRARRLISWERNRLSPQSTRATMCTGYWSLMGLVHDEDLEVVAKSGRVRPQKGEEELLDVDLPVGFDRIVVDK